MCLPRITEAASNYFFFQSYLLMLFLKYNIYICASLVAQLVKNLPVMHETWARSLGWKGPLEKEKAPHSSILAWRIMDCIVHGVTELDMTE